MNGSPHVVVFVARGATGVSVLRAAGSFTGTGLMAMRDRIAAGQAVIDEEMFTNAWFDERAEQLLGLLTTWQEQGVLFDLWETSGAPSEDQRAPITLQVLRNIVDASADDPTDTGRC